MDYAIAADVPYEVHSWGCNKCNMYYTGEWIEHNRRIHPFKTQLPAKPKRVKFSYNCESCKYHTDRKDDMMKHIQTKKHQVLKIF